MAKTTRIKWLPKPEAHDYPAALSYLCLHYPTPVATRLVGKLKRAAMTTFKAKDIFRASSLSLLGVSNGHVDKVRAKIAGGGAWSPLLLVRAPAIGKVIIADVPSALCGLFFR